MLSSLSLQEKKGHVHPDILRRWPSNPRRLNGSISRRLNTSADAVLISFPILCIIYGIASVRLNMQPTAGNGLGSFIEQVSRVGPTIFPIVFAAIVSRALNITGRALAETGIKLGSLKSLITSSNIFNAFVSPLELQRLSLGGLLLMCLWSLSPLGGQASLRIVSKSNRTAINPVTLRYMDTGPYGLVYFGESIRIAFDGQVSPSIPAAYGAALMQSTNIKEGPEDAWGNIKVPRIESLDPSTADSNGWIPFSSGNVDTYSSLIGLPVVGIPSVGAVKFTVESSYLALSCPGYESVNHTKGSNFEISSPQNPTGKCLEQNTDRIHMLLGDNYTSITNTSELIAQELDLAFSDGQTYSRCTVTQTNVETSIQCSGGSCSPTAVRKSKTDHRPNNVTVFDYWGGVITMGITNASSAQSEYSSASELFLSNPWALPVTQVISSGPNTGAANYSSLTPDLLSARASIILNTYAQLVLSSTGFGANKSATNLSLYGPYYKVPATAFNNTVLQPDADPTDYRACEGSKPLWMVNFKAPFVGVSTTASHALASEVYLTSYGWAAVMFVSATALLCTAVIGVVLRLRVKGPDVFDPVAAWTYDNPAFPVPSGGTTMDIGERIRVLKNVEVRLGDVWGERNIGKVALGSKSETDKLVSGKFYI